MLLSSVISVFISSGGNLIYNIFPFLWKNKKFGKEALKEGFESDWSRTAGVIKPLFLVDISVNWRCYQL